MDQVQFSQKVSVNNAENIIEMVENLEAINNIQQIIELGPMK